jgi:hypothetical protein
MKRRWSRIRLLDTGDAWAATEHDAIATTLRLFFRGELIIQWLVANGWATCLNDPMSS